MKSFMLAIIAVLLFSSFSYSYSITWSDDRSASSHDYYEWSRTSTGNIGTREDGWTRFEGSSIFKITKNAGESDLLNASLDINTVVFSIQNILGRVITENNVHLFIGSLSSNAILYESTMCITTDSDQLSSSSIMRHNTSIMLQAGVDYFSFLEVGYGYKCMSDIFDKTKTHQIAYHTMDVLSTFDLSNFQEVLPTTPVPEPSAIILLGVGLFGIAVQTKRTHS